MEVKYTNFEVDENICGQNEICAINEENSNFLYENIYDVRELEYGNGMTVGFFLKFWISKMKKEFVNDMLEKLEFGEDFTQKKLKQLSSGELIKVLIMKACISDSKTIILDHIDTYLNQKDIAIILKGIKNNIRLINKSIILTTNNLDLVSMYVDRVITVKNNKVIYNGSDFNDEGVNSEIKEFIKKANKKGASLNNYKDPNDLLKAIYRSVK